MTRWLVIGFTRFADSHNWRCGIAVSLTKLRLFSLPTGRKHMQKGYSGLKFNIRLKDMDEPIWRHL